MDGFKSLKEGQRVEFEEANGPKGPAATRIRPV
jgi:CspA family cold shock protein